MTIEQQIANDDLTIQYFSDFLEADYINEQAAHDFCLSAYEQNISIY